jgi:hypothetical protein
VAAPIDQLSESATVELTGSNRPDRVVRVSLRVESDRLMSITSDSTVQITREVLGDKFVDITSGVNPQNIPPGGEIRFKGATELMKSIDVAQFQKQVKVIETLMEDIKQGHTLLVQLVTDDEM